jgi:hypothetical protein
MVCGANLCEIIVKESLIDVISHQLLRPLVSRSTITNYQALVDGVRTTEDRATSVNNASRAYGFLSRGYNGRRILDNTVLDRYYRAIWVQACGHLKKEDLNR